MKSARKALTNYRKRAKRAGLARLEVQVRKEDAPLVREFARALNDPKRGAKARALARKDLGIKTAERLKALLAAAPLEGLDLSRPRDLGRDVDL